MKFLANYEEKNNGEFQFDGKELEGQLKIGTFALNQAVEYAASRMYVKTIKHMGTHPYVFAQVQISTEGRVALEDAQVESANERDMDDLLPILSRKQFNGDLEAQVVERFPGRPIALMLIDIDHFKAVNDNYGHPIGDEVLKGVAESIRICVEGRGSAYRYGGEEIALLLPNYTKDECIPLGERLRKSVEGLRLPNCPSVTVSIGVSVSENEEMESNKLVAEADRLLYQSKKQGRNRVSI